MKKYELTEESINLPGRTLYRIKAVRDFGSIKAGDLGGFIEKESNLSHDESCWIYSDAHVYGNACVYGDACVCDNARVYGNAQVYGEAHISDNAFIQSTNGWLTVNNVGSRNDVTTFYKDINGNIYVTCGCFCGKIDEFIRQVNEKHGNNRHGQVYRKAAELARLQLNFEEDKINE